MRCIIPQITWNSREPVLSIDFDPSCKYEDGFYRIATGGADKQVLIWHIHDPDTLKPNLLCVAELKRHLKTVNVVRFSPDGNYIASGDDDAFVLIWKNETKSEKEETWLVEKTLRRHLEDVSDLCWSPDGAFLVSGSVDNSAVLWDVKKGTAIHNWSDHVGFVNGVSYDPFNEFVVTMCIDRTLRFFNAKNGKLSHKLSKFTPPWLEESTVKKDVLDDTTAKQNEAEETGTKQMVADEPIKSPVGNKETENVNPDEPSVENVKKVHGNTPLNRMFCDADDTFCRRMTFSPKGELLMVPGGLLPPRNIKETLASSTSLLNGDVTPASSPGDGKLKGKTKLKKCGEKPATSNNAILIFCRNSMLTPCAVIPTGTSLSTVIRFSPVYYERSRSKFNYDPNFANPTAKVERLTACVGRLKPPAKTKRVLMEMPYRLVYAVATHDSIIIGDTASLEPLVNIKNIHCTRITDVSWSADGRVCVSSSTDGYCSIITFEKGELGTQFPFVQVSSGVSDCFPVPPPKKLKPKAKKKKEPKQKLVTVTSPASKPAEKPEVENTPAVEDDATEALDSPQSQSPKSAVKSVQKNTLLKWVIKKPKSEEESNGILEDKAKISGEKSGSQIRKPTIELINLVDSNSSDAIPMDIDGSSERKITSFFKNHANRSEINQRELLKLQTAPIKNTELLEASISENVQGDLMEVETAQQSSKNVNPKPTVQKSEATSSESLEKPGAGSSTIKTSVSKTSPVSSSTAKPPRRIQLITLTGAAPKKEKGNLD